MHERIKDLVEQAKQYAREQMAHPVEPMVFSATVFQQRFAELIIRECANIAKKEQDFNDRHVIHVNIDQCILMEFGL